MALQTAIPIAEQPDDKGFLKILQDNEIPAHADFQALIGCVTAMEQRCSSISSEGGCVVHQNLQTQAGQNRYKRI